MSRHPVARPTTKSAYCPSCDARMVVGEPNPDAYWMDAFLSERQVDRLLAAAAEFDKLSGEDRFTAVMFVDWASKDLQRSGYHVPEYDGIQGQSQAWPPDVSVRGGQA